MFEQEDGLVEEVALQERLEARRGREAYPFVDGVECEAVVVGEHVDFAEPVECIEP